MIEWNGRFFGVGLQYPHLLISTACGLNVLEGTRAEQEEVAVWQVWHSQKSLVGKMAGQQSDHPGIDINLKRITVALAHKSDAFAVGGPRGALAESGQLRDVGRQILLRAAV